MLHLKLTCVMLILTLIHDCIIPRCSNEFYIQKFIFIVLFHLLSLVHLGILEESEHIFGTSFKICKQLPKVEDLYNILNSFSIYIYIKFL